MKKITTVLLILFGILFPLSLGYAQTIKMGTLAPEGSVWHTVLKEMGQDWQEISNGRLRLQIYPGGVAGDDADMVRKMRVGQLQAAALTGEGLSNILEDLSVFQMPMLLRSDDELEYVRTALKDQFEAEMEAAGFKVLYWSEVGWVYLFSNVPVVKPADLKKLDVWVWAGDAAWTEALKDGGYKPVPLPATEIHTGLNSGLIDAFATTPVAALSFQWFAQAKNMMAMKWGPLTAAVVISKKTWDRIPADMQGALEAAAQKAGDRARGEIRQLEVDAIETMKGYGLTVTEVPEATVAEWRAEIMKTYPKLVGKSVPEGIYTEVAKILDTYRGGGSGD